MTHWREHCERRWEICKKKKVLERWFCGNGKIFTPYAKPDDHRVEEKRQNLKKKEDREKMGIYEQNRECLKDPKVKEKQHHL